MSLRPFCWLLLAAARLHRTCVRVTLRVAYTNTLPFNFATGSWLESGAAPSTGAPALLLRMDGTSPAPRPVSLCVTLFAVGAVNVTAERESLVASVASPWPAVLQTDGCAAPDVSFFEWESRCGKAKTAVAGRDGYMTSGVLLPGALTSGVAAALVGALAVAPGGGTIVNFHDGGGQCKCTVHSSLCASERASERAQRERA